MLGAGALGCLIFAGISRRDSPATARRWIIALFVISGLSLVAFRDRRAPGAQPDARPALPVEADVSSALFVAFAVYFGVFSIFFFTALYLDVVVGLLRAGRWPAVFAPMAAAIVVGSLLAGRWVGRVGRGGR